MGDPHAVHVIEHTADDVYEDGLTYQAVRVMLFRFFTYHMEELMSDWASVAAYDCGGLCRDGRAHGHVPSGHDQDEDAGTFSPWPTAA